MIYKHDLLAAIAALGGRPSLQDLGAHFGVTRERIRQKLRDYDVPKPRSNAGRKCAGCGTRIFKNNVQGFCLQCLKDAKRETLTCQQCGTQLQRLRSATRNNGTFCSKECFGRYGGITWGWGKPKPQPIDK